MQKSFPVIILTLLSAYLFSCTGKQGDAQQSNGETSANTEIDNMLTPEEIAEGWGLLFDGESVENWRGVYKDSFPAVGWTVENGHLVVLASDGGESTHGGDIITKAQYAEFELSLEAKLLEGGNSGIKYYVVEMQPNPKGSAIGPEFQLLDDAKHPDATKGRFGNRTIGSLYDLIPASKDKKPSPIGEWNKVRLVSKGGVVQHWLNGELVVEYTRGSQAFRDSVAVSKYKAIMEDNGYVGKYAPFGEAPEGHILLQDHGDRVEFRNIKIRNLGSGI